jgi:predicted transcriptional regulator
MVTDQEYIKTWWDIAEFLGIAETTARRWAKANLNGLAELLRRVGPGRGIVVARRDELAEYKERLYSRPFADTQHRL